METRARACGRAASTAAFLLAFGLFGVGEILVHFREAGIRRVQVALHDRLKEAVLEGLCRQCGQRSAGQGQVLPRARLFGLASFIIFSVLAMRLSDFRSPLAQVGGVLEDWARLLNGAGPGGWYIRWPCAHQPRDCRDGMKLEVGKLEKR